MTPTDSTARDKFKQIAVVGVNLFFMNMASDQQHFNKKRYLLVSTFIWLYNTLYNII